MADSFHDCLRLDFHNDFAIVWLQREPVNTMDTAMWTHLQSALREVESNPKMKGIAFLSGVRKDVFTAGNDIMELYAPKTSIDRYRYGIHKLFVSTSLGRYI